MPDGFEETPAFSETGGEVPPVNDPVNRRITGGPPPDNGVAPTQETRGRFAPGNAAGAATQFRRGRSGNPKGRPRRDGGPPPGTLAAARLIEAQAETLAQKAVEMALGGDPVAVRFCLGRLLGARRGLPVELALKPVARPRDLAAAVAAVTAAFAAGRITPDEALSLSRMLDGLPRILAAVPRRPGDHDGGDGGEDPRERIIRKLDRLARAMRNLDGLDAGSTAP